LTNVISLKSQPNA